MIQRAATEKERAFAVILGACCVILGGSALLAEGSNYFWSRHYGHHANVGSFVLAVLGLILVVFSTATITAGLTGFRVNVSNRSKINR